MVGAPRVYVANSGGGVSPVSVIDTTTNTVTATVTVGAVPSGVAVSGSRAYVVNRGGNVSVIDTSTNTVIATVTVGNSPTGVALSDDASRAYVANRDSGNVSVIDTGTNTVIATVTVGPLPLSLGDFVGPGPVPVELQSFAIE
ncbi:MAG: hypothetical protein GY713_16780 [Actinomycetia bacterium]|nr:hypothetical protein [Actinomycetes bacterium]